MKKTVTKDFKIDFIGIGAAKSGTTWLANKLRQHPRIFIPAVKEIRYFNQLKNVYEDRPNPLYGKTLEWYHSFFTEAGPEQICGEISPAYLRNENCARDIHQYNPRTKILAILRDPVHRSFSNYKSGRQWGRLGNLTFDSAIEKYPNILTNSLYYRQLKPYFDVFPGENIKVWFFSDLVKNPRALFADVLSFLNVEEFYPADLENRSNESKDVRYPWVSRLISGINVGLYSHRSLRIVKKAVRSIGLSGALSRMNEKPYETKPRLDRESEIRLRRYFLKDTEQLEKLLGRDLSDWK